MKPITYILFLLLLFSLASFSFDLFGFERNVVIIVVIQGLLLAPGLLRGRWKIKKMDYL